MSCRFKSERWNNKDFKIRQYYYDFGICKIFLNKIFKKINYNGKI